MNTLPAFRLHRSDGTSFVLHMPVGTTLLDAETQFLGKSFDYKEGEPGRWCCVEVCPMIPNVDRFNNLVWALDFATQYKFDTVTDLRELVEVADAHRLHGIALDLSQFITGEAA